jgi:hypothetical protein
VSTCSRFGYAYVDDTHSVARVHISLLQLTVSTTTLIIIIRVTDTTAYILYMLCVHCYYYYCYVTTQTIVKSLGARSSMQANDPNFKGLQYTVTEGSWMGEALILLPANLPLHVSIL